MATKNSSKPSAKSAKKTANKTSARAMKPTKSVKTTKTRKSAKTSSPASKTPQAQKFHPFHPAFGVILLIVAAIIFAFLLGGLILECSHKNAKNPDAARFASEYTSVEKQNLYHYLSAAETVELLETGTGIVFLGFPSCPWCQAYAPLLNDLAKEYGIKKIYYHNTYDDWQNDTAEYKKITELLGDHLQFDNVGNCHLYVPDVAFVVDGEIIANDWETSKDTLDASTPEEYWTEARLSAWTEKMKSNFEKYLEKKSATSKKTE